ncbi:MAG: transposase [Allobaculum sp.]|nr:transposase [Allobaculum sp.]
MISYFNISSKRIRTITDDPEGMSCVLFVGRQRLVKRKEMEKFLTSQYEL